MTPDSFSDGGQYTSETAIHFRIEELLSQGADVIDVGAESTRPGAAVVSVEDELQRLKPVFDYCQKHKVSVPFSIDTYKFPVAVAALESGFKIVNNVQGLFPTHELKHIAASDAIYIAMLSCSKAEAFHQQLATEVEIAEGVVQFAESTQSKLAAAGFSAEQIWLDPGVGFGKTDKANMHLLAYCKEWATRSNLLVGISRKSLLGRLFDIPEPRDRDIASQAMEWGLMLSGVQMIRTHNVAGLVKLREMTFGKGQ